MAAFASDLDEYLWGGGYFEAGRAYYPPSPEPIQARVFCAKCGELIPPDDHVAFDGLPYHRKCFDLLESAENVATGDIREKSVRCRTLSPSVRAQRQMLVNEQFQDRVARGNISENVTTGDIQGKMLASGQVQGKVDIKMVVNDQFQKDVSYGNIQEKVTSRRIVRGVQFQDKISHGIIPKKVTSRDILTRRQISGKVRAHGQMVASDQFREKVTVRDISTRRGELMEARK